MSSSHAPTSPPDETDEARTITYDPNDPFWRDTEDDDDDMDYVPAEGGSDDELEISFHGARSNTYREYAVLTVQTLLSTSAT
jgi:WD repeat-containing protein 23